MNNISINLCGENGIMYINYGVFDVSRIGLEFSRISQVCHCEAEEDEIAIRIPIYVNSMLSNAKLYSTIMNIGKINRISFLENSTTIIDVIPEYSVTVHSFTPKDSEYITSINFVITRNLLFPKEKEV